MKTTFKIMRSSFFKSRGLLVLSCIMMLLNLSYNIFLILPSGSVGYLPFLNISEELFRFSDIFMVFFLFISYEYCSKARASFMRESVAATALGERALYKSQFLVMLLLCVVFALPTMLCGTGLYFGLQVQHFSALIHMLLACVLQMFLPSLLGIVLGLLLATRIKRLPAYLLMTMFAIVSSSAFASIANRLGIYSIYEFFNFSLYLDFVPNSLFNISLLPYRWARLGLWIFGACVFLFLYLYKNDKRKQRVYTSLAAALCAVSAVVFLMPTSKVDMNEYYQLKEMSYYADNLQKEQAADFEVTKYDMELSIGLQLCAKVKMSLSEIDLPQYCFTLDHGYRVSKITDAKGEEVSWQQDGNYITIKNTGKQNFSSITASYSGSNMTFFSNLQGTYLSGTFPYYPKAGFHSYYIEDNQQYKYIYSPDDTEYQVRIKGFKKVYTNLEQRADGSYYGKASGVSIMSGFLDEITIGSTRVVYPFLNSDTVTEEIVKKEVEKANQYLNKKGETLALKSIFSVPNINNMGYNPIINDHMELLGFIDFIHTYNRNRINPEKEWLYLLVMFYNERPMGFQGALEQESNEEEPYEGEPIATALNELIQGVGAEKALELTDEYLFDNSDIRKPYTFLLETLNREGTR